MKVIHGDTAKIISILALAWTLTTTAYGAEPGTTDVNFDLNLTSDYVFRGITQTQGKPAIQLGVDMDFGNGAYAALWASNVDFSGDGYPSDGAHQEIDLAFGFARPLSDTVSGEIAWIGYWFPGVDPGIDYDYGEWIASLNYRGRYNLAVGYSSQVFGEEDPGWFYETSAVFDMPHDLGLEATLGTYDLDLAYGVTYHYASLGLSGQAGKLGWSLVYHDTSSEAESAFGQSQTKSRLVLNFDMAF